MYRFIPYSPGCLTGLAGIKYAISGALLISQLLEDT